MKLLYHITALAVVLVVMSACTTPIRVIEQHPGFFHGKKVTVKGKVINTLHLEDLSFFLYGFIGFIGFLFNWDNQIIWLI